MHVCKYANTIEDISADYVHLCHRCPDVLSCYDKYTFGRIIITLLSLNL